MAQLAQLAQLRGGIVAREALVLVKRMIFRFSRAYLYGTNKYKDILPGISIEQLLNYMDTLW